MLQLKKEYELERSELQQQHGAEIERQVEQAKEQTEARCKQVYMQEMKKLGQEHKDKLSESKRKQWVSLWVCAELAVEKCGVLREK